MYLFAQNELETLFLTEPFVRVTLVNVTNYFYYATFCKTILVVMYCHVQFWLITKNLLFFSVQR